MVSAAKVRRLTRDRDAACLKIAEAARAVKSAFESNGNLPIRELIRAYDRYAKKDAELAEALIEAHRAAVFKDKEPAPKSRKKT